MDTKQKSFSGNMFEGVIKLIRFKQRNTYDNLQGMKNISVPPAYFFSGSKISSENKGEYNVFNIIPKNSKSEKHILFFHGGAYVTGFSMGHWYFLGELYRKSSCSLHTPDYPRVPNIKAIDLLEKMKDLYLELMELYGSENLILMGDSAGAGLALALSQSLKKEQQASSLYLLSPWIDLSMENPEIKKMDEKDLILNIEGLKSAAKAYAGGLDLKDPRVSPLYGKLNDLPPVKIYIGDQDILMPDSILLRDKLQRANIEFEYYEIANMQHCGMLYPTREGILCKEDICNDLNNY
jgi:acetyl esterase/lipase